MIVNWEKASVPLSFIFDDMTLKEESSKVSSGAETFDFDIFMMSNHFIFWKKDEKDTSKPIKLPFQTVMVLLITSMLINEALQLLIKWINYKRKLHILSLTRISIVVFWNDALWEGSEEERSIPPKVKFLSCNEAVSPINGVWKRIER